MLETRCSEGWCPSLAPATNGVMGHIAFTWLREVWGSICRTPPFSVARATPGAGGCRLAGRAVRMFKTFSCVAGSSLPTCPLSLTPSVRKLPTSLPGIFNMQAGQREISLRGS